MSTLSTTDHSRDIAGLTYVYPVISRRAGGLSIGINFNTNNACNWRCIYCQVPGLTVGAAPALDFVLLETELRSFLNDVLNGDFYERFGVAESNRVIKDIAISGNGEPTSLAEFAEAVTLIGQIACELGIFPESRFVLISNGSLMHHPKVRAGLKNLQAFGGEVWFKFDSATDRGRKLINHASQSVVGALENLQICSELCRTKLQICLLDYNQPELAEQEFNELLICLKTIKASITIDSILLYSIERPSFQPEAKALSKLTGERLKDFADNIRMLGYSVSVSY